MERYIAVDNYCGWPKLTLMPDGSINLNCHNRPMHGSPDGYIECWKSLDEGRTFQLAGVPVWPDPGESRIDEAAGPAWNGDYLTIVDRRTQAQDKSPTLARSNDCGKTFQCVQSHFRLATLGHTVLMPYGSIIKVGTSRLAFHFWTPADPSASVDDEHISYVCFSHDDGATWNDYHVIDRGINETALWFFDDRHGVAVARLDGGQSSRRDGGEGMRLYRTTDGGKTWVYESTVTSQGMLPAHLLQLRNGELLMSYGFRFANLHGVMVSISQDEGRLWSEPNILAHYPSIDSGYPSTIQLKDGSLCTAYYCSGHQYHDRYHVGMIKWTLNDLVVSKWIGRPARLRRESQEEVRQLWKL